VIEVLWNLGSDLAEFFRARFDPLRDTVDILLVTAGIYWLLLLIRGTRAVQILVGLIVLIALSLASELFQLAALGMILERFLDFAVLIIVILFQNDIRRALARVGRGFFPSFAEERDIQIVEEIVRAAGTLSQRRHGGPDRARARDESLGHDRSGGPRRRDALEGAPPQHLPALVADARRRRRHPGGARVVGGLHPAVDRPHRPARGPRHTTPGGPSASPRRPMRS
jgi:hypothetical protein